MKRIQAINVRVFLGLYLVFYRLMGHFLTPLRSLAVLCVPNFPESREPEPWQSATAQGIHNYISLVESNFPAGSRGPSPWKLCSTSIRPCMLTPGRQLGLFCALPETVVRARLAPWHPKLSTNLPQFVPQSDKDKAVQWYAYQSYFSTNKHVVLRLDGVLQFLLSTWLNGLMESDSFFLSTWFNGLMKSYSFF